MSNSLASIKEPVKEELKLFEERFKEAMKTKVPLLDKITYYIVQRKGKQIRPLLAFLCAKACGGVTDKSYVAASLVELLHTATLVHDDVVDDSYERRGFFSINALWKNKIAVIVGDAVKAGDRLAVLEAMKMQHEITAEIDGTVAGIHAEAGTQIGADDLILEITPEAGDET